MCIENKDECDNLKNCITIIIYYEVWWNFITKKKEMYSNVDYTTVFKSYL